MEEKEILTSQISAVQATPDYVIERKIGSSGNWAVLATDDASPFEDRNALQENTTYYYRVKRSDSSAYSNEVSVKYAIETSPPIGTGYSLKASGASGNGTTNDTAALNALIASVPNGSTIIIDDGYVFNLGGSNINITKPLIFNGLGTLKNGFYTVSKITGFQMLNVNTDNFYVVLSDLTTTVFDHVKFANITGKNVYGFMTLSGNFDGLTISNCLFHDISNNGNSSTYGCAIKLQTAGTIQNVSIHHNEAYNINGPAAFWFGTYGTFTNISIDHNHIYNTCNFGIEFYQRSGTLNGTNVRLEYNIIHDIGAIRTTNIGNGCGGIYNNVTSGKFYANHNDVRRVLEVGIEGFFVEINDNYIEDTGADQLNHVINDSAGIYMHVGNNTQVLRNTIVNPNGYYGGIHRYDAGTAFGSNISHNIIKNVFNYWVAKTAYQVGDLVVSNNLWYVCKQAGISGNTAPTVKAANISDGTCKFDYKKEFCTKGINLNITGGMKYMTFNNNTIQDIQTALALSPLLNDISIQYNTHLHAGLTHGEPITFLGGYGNRTGPNIVIANNN